MEAVGQLPHRPTFLNQRNEKFLTQDQCTSQFNGRSSLVLWTFVDNTFDLFSGHRRLDMNTRNSPESIREFGQLLQIFCLLQNAGSSTRPSTIDLLDDPLKGIKDQHDTSQTVDSDKS